MLLLLLVPCLLCAPPQTAAPLPGLQSGGAPAPPRGLDVLSRAASLQPSSEEGSAAKGQNGSSPGAAAAAAPPAQQQQQPAGDQGKAPAAAADAPAAEAATAE